MPAPEHSPLPSETVHLINVLNLSPVTFERIAEETRKDPILQKVYHYIRTAWPNNEKSEMLKSYRERKIELSIQQGCIMWGQRVIIPEKLRTQMVNLLHEGHVGIVKMKGLSRSYVYWPRIDRDLEKVAQECQVCQLHSKMPRVDKDHSWMPASKPWERIHIDFAEQFMGTNFLVIIDAHSKWIEIFVQARLTSEQTIANLQRCFATYGVPKQVHSDNGAAFTSAMFEEFLDSHGIKHTTSAAYSPKTNGLAERAIQVFKAKMIKNKKDGADLHDCLTHFLLRYRTTIQQTTGKTPGFLLFGREMRTKMNCVIPEPVSGWPPSNRRSPVWDKYSRRFEVGEKVLVRN